MDHMDAKQQLRDSLIELSQSPDMDVLPVLVQEHLNWMIMVNTIVALIAGPIAVVLVMNFISQKQKKAQP